jgi:predicted  nucleic acid-binding Zn-ribbon protein
MSEPTLLSRIGNWFKGLDRNGNPVLPGHGNGGGDGAQGFADDEHGRGGGGGTAGGFGDPDPSLTAPAAGGAGGAGGLLEPRGSFLRPWAKRDAAIENLQGGITAIGELMTGIRDHLERQSKRQDELLGYLSHLPAALEQLPESNRAHAETLKAIHEQMRGQEAQQSKLGEILEKISAADGQNVRALDALQQHVDQLRRHDEAVAQNLGQVGEAMKGLGDNTATSAAVLQQLREDATTRGSEIERILPTADEPVHDAARRGDAAARRGAGRGRRARLPVPPRSAADAIASRRRQTTPSGPIPSPRPRSAPFHGDGTSA